MSNKTDLQEQNATYAALVSELQGRAINNGDMTKAVYDADGDGIVDKATVADGLTDTLIHDETSYTPTATGAQSVYTVTLQPGIYLYNIEVTWSKINTATKLIVRNSFNKVPSKVYGQFATSNITPGIQSTDIIKVTAATDVSTQIWPEDSTSLKAYTVHTKIFKLA